VRVTSLALLFLCTEPALISSGPAVARAQSDIELAIDIAAEVGAGVVLVPFFGKNKIETDAELNTAIESLQPLVEVAEAKGVTIGVENALNHAQNQAMMDGLSSPRVLTYYDVGNVMARKLDPADGIRQLGTQAIAMLHFKDVKLTEGAPPDFNVPLGGGNVQFRSVVQALKAVGYDGWLIMETPPGDDAVASAKANLEYVRAILAQG
ncbi:MAG: sugar phosphate isomerase/epimerase, partial [Planctomycetaceae bacterium]